MKFSGNYELPSAKSKVWEFITDPFVLKECIPSCKEIHLINVHEYKADIIIKLGFFKIPFSVDLKLNNLVANDRYDLHAIVNGGPAKSTTASSKISLQQINPTKCQLDYHAQAEFNDTISKINESVISFAAKKWLDKFFARLSDKLTQEQD